jgi:hypothetical protein
VSDKRQKEKFLIQLLLIIFGVTENQFRQKSVLSLLKLQAELSGVRAATAALGRSAGKEIRAAKESAKKSAKRVRKMTREGRLAISRAAKKRWAEWKAKKG